ncbi:hypothetical protein N9368_00085 [Alphaproteobacteria bacterium]|nr:hypothetical protein [Alphaproteobacteria bacterium]
MSIIQSQDNYQLWHFNNNTNRQMNASIAVLFAFMALSIAGCTSPYDTNFDSKETSGISETTGISEISETIETSETPEVPEMIVIIVHEPLHSGQNMPVFPFLGPTGMFEIYPEGFGPVYNTHPMPHPTTSMEAQQYWNNLFGN